MLFAILLTLCVDTGSAYGPPENQWVECFGPNAVSINTTDFHVDPADPVSRVSFSAQPGWILVDPLFGLELSPGQIGTWKVESVDGEGQQSGIVAQCEFPEEVIDSEHIKKPKINEPSNRYATVRRNPESPDSVIISIIIPDQGDIPGLHTNTISRSPCITCHKPPTPSEIKRGEEVYFDYYQWDLRLGNTTVDFKRTHGCVLSCIVPRSTDYVTLYVQGWAEWTGCEEEKCSAVQESPYVFQIIPIPDGSPLKIPFPLG